MEEKAEEEEEKRGAASCKMTCFGCLERQIHSDFSPDLVFRYGVSHSALPFGSAAVVEVNLNNGAQPSTSEEVAAQFLLARFADEEDVFLDSDCVLGSSAVDDQSGEERSSLGNDHHQNEIDVGLLNKNSIHSAFINTGSHHSFDYPRRFLPWYRPSSSINWLITALSPGAYVGIGSYPTVEELVRKLLSGSAEDHVMSCLYLLLEGNAPGPYGADFLNSIGVPYFVEKNIPGCVRHPNIAPVLGMLKTPGHINLLQPKAPYTLETVLHYSPNVLKSDWHIRFLLYQLLSALTYVHGLGYAHGNICPSSIMLTDACWSWLSICDGQPGTSSMMDASTSSTNVCCCVEKCPCQTIYADLRLSTSIDWTSDFKRWWVGELSNYEYLLILNKIAGRRWGDHTFHTVIPWVIDFSVKPDESSDAGWRDLHKSKWRLAKGDEQLDFTYSTSEVPHHVSDECLSELAVCSYKARRLPLSVLRSAVRSVYEPNEYPSNMQRLYQWTPDECIPEFYSDHRIFSSIHPGMIDLIVPSWAKSPGEFISLHRAALESDRVSRQIHHWIDITFGYKLSGEASVIAKNVMLPTSDDTMPKSMGRRQLFTIPHPMRKCFVSKSCYNPEENHITCHMPGNGNRIDSEGNLDPTESLEPECLLSKTCHLKELEEVAFFCEHARFLSPIYSFKDDTMKDMFLNRPSDKGSIVGMLKRADTSGEPSASSDVDLACLLETFVIDDNDSTGFQELLRWRQRSSESAIFSEHVAGDMFSVGCILAELYLKRPLFDSVSLTAYSENDVLPGLIQELPPHVRMIVESCILKDWRRRPSAKSFLESQYFPLTVRSVYLFTAPLQILSTAGARLQLAAKLSREGALKAMGPFAAEICAPYCLTLITTPLSDTESESALCLMKEFVKCLMFQAIKLLILPTIQKILQVADCSHLKISLLQDSFVREVWKHLGKQVYLEKMHPLIISNLCNSPNKTAASAASVLLIGSSEELGLPVTIHQTILPLIHSFGKGLSVDGIDALVRIGGLLGENFVIRHLLPLLRNVVSSCIDVSHVNKPEPLLSWNSLALIDCFATLDGLVKLLPKEVVLKELVLDRVCLHVQVLMQTHLDLSVIQVVATALITVCQRIGSEFTAAHVLPQLKELFDELAFSQEASVSYSSGRNLKVSISKLDNEVHLKSRSDLVLLLYPSFASLIGVEKLRQCCATWFLLEQFLQRCHNWKSEFAEASRSDAVENTNIQRATFSNVSSVDYNPAKLLLNGVGWSVPQSQGARSGKSSMYYNQKDDQRNTVTKNVSNSNLDGHDPWFWFPSAAVSWDVTDFLGRVGGLKDELPWKVKASVLCSARAHPGTLRSLAVCHDECTIFTGGVGPGFKGTIQKWELPSMNCISGYYGHDEVVNDIRVLPVNGRIASCDGTIHIWNSLTGKLISSFAESSTIFPYHPSSLPASKVNGDPAHMLTSNSSNGIYSNAFSGSMYTSMHYLDFDDKLVAGMGNGSIRFIDVAQDRKLHLWKSDAVENSLSSLVSAICSCGSDKLKTERTAHSPSWLAAGLSSGHCRLLDARSGEIVALWRAHDGYITKLAASGDHLLVSSSLDKTLRIWDLRRNLSSQSNIFTGHSDGISSFAMWGHDIISISRNKIGLSSLSRSAYEQGGQKHILPQKLYSADKGMRNLSVLSTISILPFSRLFVVGTEDGYLKICC